MMTFAHQKMPQIAVVAHAMIEGDLLLFKIIPRHTDDLGKVRIADPAAVCRDNHHILDPDTGFPAETDVIGVTVVSESSAQGDALSTVCLLLGREEGSRLLETCDGVQGAVWVDSEGQVYVQGDLDFTSAP